MLSTSARCCCERVAAADDEASDAADADADEGDAEVALNSV